MEFSSGICREIWPKRRKRMHIVKKTNARLSYLKCIKFFSGQKYSQHFSQCKKGILAIFISTTTYSIHSLSTLRKLKWYVEKSDRDKVRSWKNPEYLSYLTSVSGRRICPSVETCSNVNLLNSLRDGPYLWIWNLLPIRFLNLLKAISRKFTLLRGVDLQLIPVIHIRREMAFSKNKTK